MNANAFNAAFDEAAFDAFEGAGLACRGLYTPPAPAVDPEDPDPPAPPAAFERRAFVDTGSQTQGEWSQVHSPLTTIRFFLADGALARGATFVVGASTWTLDRVADDDARDGSLQRWVVSGG